MFNLAFQPEGFSPRFAFSLEQLSSCRQSRSWLWPRGRRRWKAFPFLCQLSLHSLGKGGDDISSQLPFSLASPGFLPVFFFAIGESVTCVGCLLAVLWEQLIRQRPPRLEWKQRESSLSPALPQRHFTEPSFLLPLSGWFGDHSTCTLSVYNQSDRSLQSQERQEHKCSCPL